MLNFLSPGGQVTVSTFQFIMAPASALSVATAAAVMRVDGHFDAAIDDPARFNMALAELHMSGLFGQTLEVMSTDINCDHNGLDPGFPGHFPIGTLRIGTTSNIVLVDNHDNDGLGQSIGEALYVENLIVESGAMLFTGGLKVYYSSLVLNGGVDNPSNLIEIPDAEDIANGMSLDCDGDLVPDECEIDTDGDGIIDDCDTCPDSDLSETVVIGGVDTGVDNELLGDGCTIADLIDAILAADPSTADVVQFLVDLKAEGIITGRDLGAILKALNSP